ncbi:fungal-trans domain-containing protein [Favolaschia claudopus]|uniref:Fungal-trans domain-containing protein n=1 Tax=Favolaschia claudopus TaxID=2862362 RepID=A0AAW0A0H2_9AGAR
MANKTLLAEGATTLQRGKACLRCRKRKMRCDGAKPACQQCTRAKKSETCEYDDGKGKTRTQLLRETIVRLEQRVRELEDPDYISPAVTLFDPRSLRGFSESPPSSSYDSADASFSAGHSPFPSAESPAHSPEGSWGQGHSGASASPPLFAPDIFFQEPQMQQPQPHQFQPPVDLATMLLEIFAPHRQQCGLDIHMGQLRESLGRPRAEQRHPALMNAIFLWACFISRPEPLSQHEEHYLTQALDALRDALREGDKMVDAVQASCLLSSYFLANGRILEGSYHASAAAALAVQCGFHEDVVSDASSWLVDASDELKPSKMDIQQGERILAFWQVYNLDRCWSVALRKPTIIPDGAQAWNSINCPWPMDIAEYQAGVMSSGVNFHTIKSFLEGDVVDNGYSTPALRAKASALLERADSLSATWDPRNKLSDSLPQEIHAFELTINSFASTLPPLHQLTSMGPENRAVFIAIHTITQAAILHLYQRFAPDDPVSYDKCSRAARACGAVITQITDPDFVFLDPILGPCWTTAAETLLREVSSLSSAWPPINTTDIRNELGTILYAMTKLASRFPLLGISAAKLQKQLAEL